MQVHKLDALHNQLYATGSDRVESACINDRQRQEIIFQSGCLASALTICEVQ